MIPFLKQVAQHYMLQPGDISRLCFIFPNRRALRFFEHYLGEAVAESGSGPVLSPQLFTMNDFFYRTTGAGPSDRISLLLVLYDCYKSLNKEAEPLDDFIFWGDTLLGDFDDIDKYLVDAGQLLVNVEELKQMQDDWSWLSGQQKEAIERFTRHFLTQGAVKDGFVRIWNLLLPLYRNFRRALEERGLCYEGMVYRSLAERLSDHSAADLMAERHPFSDRFVFVGLNALNECEKTLLRKLQNAGLAEFCWDFRSSQIQDMQNRSSFFLKDFSTLFPSSFEPDPDGLPETEFNVLSVPGGIAQAKQLPEILSRCTDSPDIDTAVVLPDETMLIPVLNSIPEHVQKLNVTMGYPFSGSQLSTLLGDLAALQMHLRLKDGVWHFYHRQLWALCSNSILRTVLSAEAHDKLEALRKKRLFYIPQVELSGDPVLEAIFRPMACSADADPVQAGHILAWLQDVLVTLAPGLKAVPGMQLELDFAKLCHESLSSLGRHSLALTPQSLFRLIGQLLAPATVPFQGEPLEGMQIMGPLELRAMDFDNLIILNFNEGVFPRRSVSASFIPPELRRGFGLPSYEYQDAVWAYYFYRMVQRASKVWMVFDSRTEGVKSGEPSRYLYQLEMHFGVKVNHYEALSALGREPGDEDIPKKAEDIAKLKADALSASSVKAYLACPVKFYYAKVEGLKAEKELSESLDAGMFGNVLHKAMQKLYPKGTVLDESLLGKLIGDKKRIRELVEELICQELNTFEVSGRNIVYADVICGYVDAVLKADLRQVKAGGNIQILGVEQERWLTIGDYKFKGYIDRLDSVCPGKLRVVDYKTGRVQPDDLYFNPKTGNVPQIGLQLYLYKRFVEKQAPEITGAIYQPPSLMSGEAVIEHSLDEEFCSAMEESISGVLEELSDLSIPWKRTPDAGNCKFCDFRAICGR